MTYGEAIEAGYIPYEGKWERGYISRKVDLSDQPVLVAGGRRSGELYVPVPSWDSTTYHKRLYLAKKPA